MSSQPDALARPPAPTSTVPQRTPLPALSCPPCPVNRWASPGEGVGASPPLQLRPLGSGSPSPSTPQSPSFVQPLDSLAPLWASGSPTFSPASPGVRRIHELAGGRAQCGWGWPHRARPRLYWRSLWGLRQLQPWPGCSYKPGFLRWPRAWDSDLHSGGPGLWVCACLHVAKSPTPFGGSVCLRKAAGVGTPCAQVLMGSQSSHSLLLPSQGRSWCPSGPAPSC